MDVESPQHLERLRDLPEIKVALLRFPAGSHASEARFERSGRNTLYWPPVEALAARFLASCAPEEIRTPVIVYGRACWIISTLLTPAPGAPYAIAIAAADGVEMETIVGRLRAVSHDYWHGSYFFK